VRSKEQIASTGAYDRDQFVPVPQSRFSELDLLFTFIVYSTNKIQLTTSLRCLNYYTVSIWHVTLKMHKFILKRWLNS